MKFFVFMQIRCNFPDISYLSETQKNNFQFFSKQSKSKTSVLIWIQTVWHSDSVPERFFFLSYFWKKSAGNTTKAW